MLTVCEFCGLSFEDGYESRLQYEVPEDSGLGAVVECEHFYPDEYEMAVGEVALLAHAGISWATLTPRQQALYDEIAYDETRVEAGYESEVQ